MNLLIDRKVVLSLCLVFVTSFALAARGADAPASQATSQPALKPAKADKNRAAGLVGEYFKGVKTLADLPTDKPPFFVQVDGKINTKHARGQFNNSKLANDFGVRWSGYYHADKAGEVTFSLKSDDGSRLYIGDQLIIDNAKPEDSMKEKTGKADFSKAGDYAIRVEYYNAGGPAGIILSFVNPAGKTVGIPDKKLTHDASQIQVAWDKAAWEKATFSYKKWAAEYGENYDKMDYGPFFCATIAIDQANENYANKGIVIHVGKGDLGTICFDADTMRWAGAWTGGFLDNHGVVFDGQHGVNPGPDGDVMYTAPVLPGAIVGDYSEKMAKDPRPHPYGILPHEWAKYRGLYLNGDRVVIHYTVGDVDVLDTPWAQQLGEQIVITRSIKLSPSDQTLTMLLDKPNAEKPTDVSVSDGVQIKSMNDCRYLVFPARKEATTYAVGVTTHQENNSKSFDIASAKDDLDALTKPGAARWGDPIVTKGEVAKSTTQPYVLDTITAPEDNKFHSWLRFGGLDFFPDGRAAITTWSGDVWIVSGIDDKLDKVQWKRFATGLFQPLGLKIVNNEIYVLGRDQITKLKDLNGDGEADSYECFNNDCEVTNSFHEFAFDLQTDKDGNFYFTKAGPVRPGGRGWQIISNNNGSVLQVSKDGSKFSVYATGLRAPNGMSISEKTGMMTVGDNEGTWVPACPIRIVHQGDVLGVPDLYHNDAASKAYVPPVCWLPHSDVDNSSGGQVWVETGDKWGPFENRLLHTSYGTCSLYLVSMETVNNVVQGGVIKFADLPFNTGICRPRFSPADHQFYVVGLRGWQTTAAKDCGFQRVRYTGSPVKMPTEFHVTHDGVVVNFTTPIDPKVAQDVGNYAVEQWNYIWSNDYGSPDLSVAEPKQHGHDPVDVTKATLSADHKTLTLKFDEVVPVMQMKIQMKLKAEDGSPMNFYICNTINQVPKAAATTAAAAASN